MILEKKIVTLIILFLLSACADYKIEKETKKPEKEYYSSFGFVLIYENTFYKDGVINKKLNGDQIAVMHSSLKKNTPIKIINPENLKSIETKILKNAKYPKIFNLVISKKVASILQLNLNNPYVEFFEIKKNKTFIAKEGNMFEEERNVVEKAPVDAVKVDDLSKIKSDDIKKHDKINKYNLVIADFYYLDSANNLKKELIKQTKIKNFLIKKINNNKYRLLVGPFKNFNSLKSSYISLNNLGFEGLNVIKE